MKSPIKNLAAAIALAASATAAQAAELTITLTNATHGIAFTPVAAAAHNSETGIFSSGSEASAGLETLAEMGGIGGVIADLEAAGADIAAGSDGEDSTPGASDGPLTAGNSVTFSLSTSAGNEYLSLAAMLLPTNDGFVGLSNWKIPTEPGTYRVNLNAYDAGTELNDELAASIPNAPFVTSFGQPGGAEGGAEIVTSDGTGVTDSGEENGVVHIHRGNLGDLVKTAAVENNVSDIQANLHRWLNPVARLTVVVADSDNAAEAQ